ncbi:hypothetical protein COA01_33745 [Bacillus cereus]|uniref:hypothetical protein n=1 Tax=Bacillus cereus TaxID=1396 RepID=UPI000BFE2997|nr:hypothetical protein [Bacillus cereus]PGP12783.1 hypothetical protein COA01_33745 [Bacillus cereus]
MKTLKSYMIFGLIGIGVLLGFANSETLIYADNDVPYLNKKADSSDEKTYGQTKEGAQKTIDGIAGKNKDEMILDMNGLEVFHKQGNNFVEIIAGLMWGFCFLVIVAAGFKIALSEGNKQAMTHAKMQIIFAGIGIGVSSLVFVIIKLFQDVLS